MYKLFYYCFSPKRPASLVEPDTTQLFFQWIYNLNAKKFCGSALGKMLSKEKDSCKQNIIIDAGAHIGDTALWLAMFAKKAERNVKVVAIDPNQDKVNFMNKMIKLNQLEDYMIVVKSAVGDKSTKGSEIVNASGKTAMNRIEPDSDGESLIQKTDDIINNLDLGDYKIGIVHFDVEGYEYKALLGAQGIMKKYKPLFVVEILFDHSSDGLLKTNIHNLMKKNAFANSDKLVHEFGNTVFYDKKNSTHLDLLKRLFL